MPRKSKKDKEETVSSTKSTTPSPEYRFIISPTIDERTQNKVLLLTLETTRVFRSFQYNILISEKHSENSFHFKIEGLTMNNLTIPATGPDISVPLEPGPELDKRMAVVSNFLDGLSLAPKEREEAAREGNSSPKSPTKKSTLKKKKTIVGVEEDEPIHTKQVF